MAVDIYTPVELAGAIRQQAPSVGFFTQFFKFSPSFFHGTEKFLIDQVDGVTGIATYVNRDGEFVKVPNEGYTTNEFKPGYVKEVMTLTAGDLRAREAGVPSLLESQNPGDSRTMKIGKQQAQLQNRLARLKELQASQALLTGVVSISGVGVSYDIDFGLKSTHKIAPSILWGTSDTATPVDDLKSAARIIADEAATLGTNFIAIMSVDSFKAFKATTQVQNELKMNGFGTGKISPKAINALGARYEGYLDGFGEIWTYSRKYRSASNVSTDYMTTKTVIVLDLSCQLEQHYGVIENLHAGDMGVKSDMYPRSYMAEEGNVIKNTLESSPLMAPVQTDGYCVLTVLS